MNICKSWLPPPRYTSILALHTRLLYMYMHSVLGMGELSCFKLEAASMESALEFLSVALLGMERLLALLF